MTRLIGYFVISAMSLPWLIQATVRILGALE